MELSLWKPIAGIALFLLALSLIESALRTLAGPRFKSLLINHTSTGPSGVLSGTVATAILQSSSFVSLLMLAFVGARLLPLKNAIAVVIGANLGTTATGWIVATVGFKLDLDALALPLIGIGGLLATLLQAPRWKELAQLCLALGLLLLGLQYMKGAIEGVASLANPDTLASMGVWHYLLIGIVLSALMQSSSAVMVIALSALHTQVIGLPEAAAVAIGADLGTTSTVLLGALGTGANKKRVALGHLLFNLVTDVTGFVFLIPILAGLAWIGEPTLTLVAFHSTVNVIGIVMFLPFLSRFSEFLERRFVTREEPLGRYIAEVSAAIPEAAVVALRQELRPLLEQVATCGRSYYGLHAASAARRQTVSEQLYADEAHLEHAYEQCKALEGEMLGYGVGLDRSALEDADLQSLEATLTALRSAVVSLKGTKEAREDLLELVDVESELCRSILDRQRRLYDQLDGLIAFDKLGEVEPLTARSAQLDELVESAHLRTHEEIVTQLRRGAIAATKVSTALNLNRVIYHSNRALVAAVVASADALAEPASV
ncbi:MAG: Na/Pi symporter [Pseudomonadales bacterium]